MCIRDSQRAVPAHQHTPGVLVGQMDHVVPGQIHRRKQKSEVNEPFVQILPHVGGIAAGNMEADVRIGFLQLSGRPGQVMDPHRLTGANVHLPGNGLLRLGKLLLGLLHQIQDLLGTFAQQHSLRGQGHTMAAAHKQLLAKLLFQIVDLAGQGRLCLLYTSSP